MMSSLQNTKYSPKATAAVEEVKGIVASLEKPVVQITVRQST